MKHFALLSVLFIFINSKLFSQKSKVNNKPHLLQSSIRAGLINVSLNVEYRISPKTISSFDLGFGVVRLQSNYYNKFNENYSQFDNMNTMLLNFGTNWNAPFTSFQLKRIINSKSKIKYNLSPFANTYTYYGVQLKYNAKEGIESPSNEFFLPFRETYQFGAMFGRQIESRGKGSFVLDYYIGLGGIANYNLKHIDSKLLLGLRTGINLYKYNK